MSIGKLALAAMTLFGLAIGVHEGIRLAGGLAVIVIAQILLFGAAMAVIVRLARADRAQQAHGPRDRDGAPAPVARSASSPETPQA